MRACRRSLVLAFALLPAALAFAQDTVPQHPRTILIAFDPILENQTSKRLHVACHWNDPVSLTATYSADLADASYDLMQYRRHETLVVDEFPRHLDGFRYTDQGYWDCYSGWSGWHMAGTDYKSQVRDYDLARKCDAGIIDEVLIHSFPYTGYYESTMCGRGGYFCNSGPQQRIACTKIFIMMGYNFERGVGEMLEDYGHRAESILWHTYGSWSTSPTHAWNRFTLHDKTSPGNAACGNVHFAPNSDSDYDWGNTRDVVSTCDDWLNYPMLEGLTRVVDCAEWGYGDMREHHIWWFAHMPHVSGSVTEYSMTRLNNWWEYMQNFNYHAESGGDYRAATPPPATLYAGPTRVFTANLQDDWSPRISSCGKVVWYGRFNNHYQIFSANLDGTGLLQITNNLYENESPELNSAGQIVWQAFDGRDYEIFTANADGTDIRQITSNTVMDWHPHINNAGKIVWAGFDGEDYEIFSANVDGTGLVQITNNSMDGQPADDLWPQINNASPARVAWMGWDGGDWEIYSANVDGTGLANVSDNSREDEYPRINDANRVVWHSFHDNTNTQIWSANADGSNRVQLSSNANEDWYPQINNDGQVVWMGRDSTDWEIYTAGATGVPAASAVTNNSTNDTHPVIDDNGRIVWQGWDGTDFEIYMRADGVIQQVTNNDYDDRAPSVGDLDAFVWHAESSGGPLPTSEIRAAGAEVGEVIPPVLLDVRVVDRRTLQLRFSEPLEPNSANAAAHYAITPPLTVLAATLAPNQSTVLLDIAPLTPNIAYTLTVAAVTDLATPPNFTPPGTHADFTYLVVPRITDGLAALYEFDETAGTVIHDTSGLTPALDLNIEYPQNTSWTGGGWSIDAGPYTRAATSTGAARLANACIASDALTIETWLVPADALQYGPARIITLSSSTSNRNFTLGHGDAGGTAADKVDVRVRAANTDANGRPALNSPEAALSTILVHVVYTRDALGAGTLYIDGEPVATESRTGTFDGWNTAYRLALGNEMNFNPTNGWRGEYRLVAIYSRALSADEVTQNLLAGADPSDEPLVCPGDANCNGFIDWRDIDYFVAGLNDNETGWSARFAGGPSCPFANLDVNANGHVDWRDIDPFVSRLNHTCE